MYNHSQLTAIESAVSLVKEPFCVPRFLLVSGPPGTGKTHTLVGMIQAMLEVSCDQWSENYILQLLEFENNSSGSLCFTYLYQ